MQLIGYHFDPDLLSCWYQKTISFGVQEQCLLRGTALLYNLYELNKMVKTNSLDFGIYKYFSQV